MFSEDLTKSHGSFPSVVMRDSRAKVVSDVGFGDTVPVVEYSRKKEGNKAVKKAKEKIGSARVRQRRVYEAGM